MKRLMLAVLVTLFMSGCASLTNNLTQPVVVSTTCGDQPVQGASCRIINANGSWTVTSTPGSVMIRKAASDLAVDCKLPQSQAQAMPVVAESHATTGAWGNLLAGGLLGFGVDSYRDAAWKYDTDVVIDMCKDVPQRVSQGLQSSTAVAAIPTAPQGGVASMTSTLPAGQMHYAFSAEAMAKQQKCSANPIAVLNARGGRPPRSTPSPATTATR